ncbi:hypothetical protein K439DRAFT_853881 [Ramaria rubella]|nr:hypothetical protein K439DRAFT_853881 [Ramaria rubella]
MKFARYLDETKIPEWKRAYIDFKGLKKRVAAIKKTKQKAAQLDPPHRDALSSPAQGPVSYGSLDHTPPRSPRQGSPVSTRVQATQTVTDDRDNSKQQRPTPPSPSLARSWSQVLGQIPRAVSTTDRNTGRRSSVPRLLATVTRMKSNRTMNRIDIDSLYTSLEPLELSFFTYLDEELDKVDMFYNEREGEAILKLSALKDQLRELAEHRRLFHEAQASTHQTWNTLPRALGGILNEVLGVSKGQDSEVTDTNALKRKVQVIQSVTSNPGVSLRDPAEYHHAKRKLKKAFQEFYRSLELLNDYRVGFTSSGSVYLAN